jgi:uncharacterized protein YcbX
VIRIVSGGVVVDIAEEIDRGNLAAGWNTVVSSRDVQVEVYRDAVEAEVASYEVAKAEAESRLESVRSEFEAVQVELAESEAEAVKGGVSRG